MGAGNSALYHLNIDNYHRGQLFLVEECLPGLPRDLTKEQQYKWRFSSPSGEFEDLSSFFEAVLISWY